MQQVDRHELNQMRCMMEVSSAKLAAEQMSAAELHSLEHLALNMIQTKNKDLHTLDEEFHDILLQGTKNKFMITIMQVFSDMCRESIEQTLAHASLEQLQQLCQQHLTIAQKMKAHDARGIEEAVIKHYELLEEQKS